MGVQDWVSAYRIGITHLRLIYQTTPFRFVYHILVRFGFSLVLLALALTIFYFGYVAAWHRLHMFPWHYMHTVLPTLAVGPAVFVLLHCNMSARKVTLENQCITVNWKKGSESPRYWRRISGVLHEPEYIAICSASYVALVIPRRAFPNDQAFNNFFDMALSYWHEANGIMPLPAPNVSGVWPPAPIISRRDENTRELFPAAYFCGCGNPDVKISYRILPADIRRNFRHSLSRSRNKGVILLLLLSIVPLSMIFLIIWDAWSRNVLGISTVIIIIAFFVPLVLVGTIFSMQFFEHFYPNSVSAPLSTTEITAAFMRFDNRRMQEEDELLLEPIEVSWSDVSGIYWYAGDIVFQCFGRISNNFIPKSAFANPQEAELFYNTARQYLEAARDNKTVWPPTPLASRRDENARE